jgi:serine/threonine protein kinase
VLAFKLLSGEYPFIGDSSPILNRQILKVDYQCPSFFGPKEKTLFGECFKLNALSRPSAKDLLNFEFFS